MYYNHVTVTIFLWIKQSTQLNLIAEIWEFFFVLICFLMKEWNSWIIKCTLIKLLLIFFKNFWILYCFVYFIMYSITL